MNVRMVIAVVLIVLGVLALVYQGFSYTTRERVVDAGPVKVDVNKEHRVPVAPIVGGVAVVAGVALLFMGRRGGITK